MNITGAAYITGSCTSTFGFVGNSITIGGSTSSAKVVTGSGAFSQDLSAKSIKLKGAQLPITNTIYVSGSCSVIGALIVTGDGSITGKISAATMKVSSNVTMPGY